MTDKDKTDIMIMIAESNDKRNFVHYRMEEKDNRGNLHNSFFQRSYEVIINKGVLEFKSKEEVENNVYNKFTELTKDDYGDEYIKIWKQPRRYFGERMEEEFNFCPDGIFDPKNNF